MAGWALYNQNFGATIITPSCITTGYTGEKNNATLGSCSTGNGSYQFKESVPWSESREISCYSSKLWGCVFKLSPCEINPVSPAHPGIRVCPLPLNHCLLRWSGIPCASCGRSSSRLYSCLPWRCLSWRERPRSAWLCIPISSLPLGSTPCKDWPLNSARANASALIVSLEAWIQSGVLPTEKDDKLALSKNREMIRIAPIIGEIAISISPQNDFLHYRRQLRYFKICNSSEYSTV